MQYLVEAPPLPVNAHGVYAYFTSTWDELRRVMQRCRECGINKFDPNPPHAGLFTCPGPHKWGPEAHVETLEAIDAIGEQTGVWPIIPHEPTLVVLNEGDVAYVVRLVPGTTTWEVSRFESIGRG